MRESKFGGKNSVQVERAPTVACVTAWALGMLWFIFVEAFREAEGRKAEGGASLNLVYSISGGSISGESISVSALYNVFTYCKGRHYYQIHT
jgi:hypothetical protein